MATTPGELKYLFRAMHNDGSVVIQNQDDISAITPGASAFRDITPDDVSKFWLVGQGQQCMVDLATGIFTLNGTTLDISPQYFVPTEPLRIIYFREVHKKIDLNGVVNADMSVSQEVTAKQHYVNRYFIGWQTTYEGKNLQRTIALL